VVGSRYALGMRSVVVRVPRAAEMRSGFFRQGFLFDSIDTYCAVSTGVLEVSGWTRVAETAKDTMSESVQY